MKSSAIDLKQIVFFCLLLSLAFAANIFAQGVNQAKVLDSNGDNKTDFHIITRENTGNGFRTRWCSRINGNQTSQVGCGGFSLPLFSGTEYTMGGDIDGDGDSELIFYRTDPGNPSYQSNFTIYALAGNNPQQIVFGTSADDPTVIGDYTGDGKADAAVFRCNPLDAAGTQCYWIYRASEIGLHTWVPWGSVYAPGKADTPAPGDYDGDGKNDFAVRRLSNPNDETSQTVFYILRSSDGGVEYRAFGIGTDRVVKGDFDGDRKTDLCVVRNSQTEGAQMYWFINYSGTGLNAFYIPWGLGRGGAVGDYIAPGDYNGDGRTDITVWRRTAVSETTVFYVLQSTATPGVFGSMQADRFDACQPVPCEYPAAQFQVH